MSLTQSVRIKHQKRSLMSAPFFFFFFSFGRRDSHTLKCSCVACESIHTGPHSSVRKPKGWGRVVCDTTGEITTEKRGIDCVFLAKTTSMTLETGAANKNRPWRDNEWKEAWALIHGGQRAYGEKKTKKDVELLPTSSQAQYFGLHS